MANLETLFIEIDGNASKASSGIDTLIGSLSSLGAEIGKQIGSIKELASALKDIRGAATGGNIWKNLAPSASAVKKSTRAAQEVQQAWADTHKVVAEPGTKFNGWDTSVVKRYDPQAGAFSDIMTKEYKIADSGRIKAADALGYKDGRNTKSITEYKEEMDKTAKVTDKATESNRQFAESTKEIKKSAEIAKQAHHTTRGLLSQIGRIAKTMLIRTAIRSLMKVAKEGLNNFYEYSKAIGNGYATAIDSMKTKAGTAGNQIGAALGTLLSTIMPIVNSIISLVSAAAEAVTMLFSLFGGSTTYSKAVNGFNSVGSAAGGAGKKVKELLADFDELNVISQESSGGGGGGGGGSFGSMFQEMQLPEWMIEWKPLLEALAFGTIGALVLPEIWEWLKKIIDLFTGGGASNLLNILKYMFKKKTPGDDTDDLSVDIKGLEKNAGFAAALAASLEAAKKALQDINREKMPSFAVAATEMGIFSAAAVAAAPAIEKIVAALEALKAGGGVMNLLQTLITTLISKLGGSTIKIKLDRKEYDDFKKEYEEWGKDKSITLKFDKEKFSSDFQDLLTLLKRNTTKTIALNLDVYKFNKDIKQIEVWIKKPIKKGITLFLDAYQFNKDVDKLTNWIRTEIKKSVTMFLDTYEFNKSVDKLNNWLKKEAKKNITVAFDRTYATFLVGAAAVDAWAAIPVTKNVIVSFPTWAAYLIAVAAVDAFCASSLTKSISIRITNGDTFSSFVSSMNSWASQTLTKRIQIVIDQSGGTASVAAQVANQLKGLAENLQNTVTNAWSAIFGSEGSSGGHGFATGGFPMPGDLFVANERSAEMVGSFNNHPAVVNNEQIIEGISRGVAEANAEQNTLLMQQNELLRRILEKDNAVRIAASSALGRTVRQSLDMYSMATGV